MARARKATKSLRSAEHKALCAILRDTRRTAGLSQTELAEKLQKPQSFVAKYEGGERRLDIIEFLKVASSLGTDPVRLLRAIAQRIQRD